MARRGTDRPSGRSGLLRCAPVACVLLAAAATLTEVRAQAPPAPEGLRLVLEETNGDFLVERGRVYWKAVPEAASYRIRFYREADPATVLTERTFTPPAGTVWADLRHPFQAVEVFDTERILATVEARDASGLFGGPALASARYGELPARRGDANEDGSADLGDALAVLFHLFVGAPQLSPQSRELSADFDGNARLEITDAVGILSWLFTHGPAPRDAEPRAGRRLLVGVFHGDASVIPMYVRMSHVEAMERWQGRKHAVLNIFSSWTAASADDLFNFQLTNAWGNGNVPMITWEPHTGDADESSVEARAAAGTYDSFWRQWATRLKSWLKGPDRKFGDESGGPTLDPGALRDNRRAYIRLGHEMNGWWTPWNATTGGNTPDDFKAMWIRVHDLLVDEFRLDGDHVQWVWCVNNADSDTEQGTVRFPCERYYPGHAYVDWLAIDGYNWGSSQPWSDFWSLPANVYDAGGTPGRMLTRLRALAPTKPIAIAEYGTTSVDGKNPTRHNLGRKSQWLSSALSYFLLNRVKMAVYFNIDKEADWAVFGGSQRRGDETSGAFQCYSAYRKALASDLFTSPDLANPRLLTDDEFRGR